MALDRAESHHRERYDADLALGNAQSDLRVADQLND
jgi:hypothetical protein